MDKYFIKTNSKRTFETLVTDDSINEINSKKKKICRKYLDSYLKLGFIDDGSDVSQPICVLCFEKLSNESLKPSKLKRHLETKHPNDKNRNLEFLRAKNLNISNKRNVLINQLK